MIFLSSFRLKISNHSLRFSTDHVKQPLRCFFPAFLPPDNHITWCSNSGGDHVKEYKTVMLFISLPHDNHKSNSIISRISIIFQSWKHPKQKVMHSSGELEKHILKSIYFLPFDLLQVFSRHSKRSLASSTDQPFIHSLLILRNARPSLECRQWNTTSDHVMNDYNVSVDSWLINSGHDFCMLYPQKLACLSFISSHIRS